MITSISALMKAGKFKSQPAPIKLTRKSFNTEKSCFERTSGIENIFLMYWGTPIELEKRAGSPRSDMICIGSLPFPRKTPISPPFPNIRNEVGWQSERTAARERFSCDWLRAWRAGIGRRKPMKMGPRQRGDKLRNRGHSDGHVAIGAHHCPAGGSRG